MDHYYVKLCGFCANLRFNLCFKRPIHPPSEKDGLLHTQVRRYDQELEMSPVLPLTTEIKGILHEYNEYNVVLNTHLLTHSPNHLLTHSPNHLLPHSPNHLLTHSPNHLRICFPSHL